jgi:hypothetical protein
VAEDVRPLTYDEIARTFGITRESARQLVIRKRWARRKGNDGKARIEVPEDAIDTSDATPPDPSHDTSDATGSDTSVPPSDSTSDDPSIQATTTVLTRHIDRLEGELSELKVALEAERVRAAELGPLKAHLEAEQRRTLELREERDLERQRASQVDALKAVLEVEQRRATELKEERDRWQERATASKGLWGWLKRGA